MTQQQEDTAMFAAIQAAQAAHAEGWDATAAAIAIIEAAKAAFEVLDAK